MLIIFAVDGPVKARQVGLIGLSAAPHSASLSRNALTACTL